MTAVPRYNTNAKIQHYRVELEAELLFVLHEAAIAVCLAVGHDAYPINRYFYYRNIGNKLQ